MVTFYRRRIWEIHSLSQVCFYIDSQSFEHNDIAYIIGQEQDPLTQLVYSQLWRAQPFSSTFAPFFFGAGTLTLPATPSQYSAPTHEANLVRATRYYRPSEITARSNTVIRAGKLPHIFTTPFSKIKLMCTNIAVSRFNAMVPLFTNISLLLRRTKYCSKHPPEQPAYDSCHRPSE